MKYIIAFIFFGILLASCSSDDQSANDEPLVTNIKFDFNKSGTIDNTSAIDFYFEYDNQQRLVRKIGGYLGMSGATGYNAHFTNDIYTSLIYSGNLVTVEEFSSSPNFNVPPKSNYYTLNNSGQITGKQIPSPYGDSFWYKSQVFEYANNKLVEIKTSLPNMPHDPSDPYDYVQTYSEKFYYDTNGNLARTEYFELHNGQPEGVKIIRTFEDYDASTNPTRRMYLLDEYFYRSLSRNNFRKYTEERYYNGTANGTFESIWTFNYDSNGNIIVN